MCHSHVYDGDSDGWTGWGGQHTVSVVRFTSQDLFSLLICTIVSALISVTVPELLFKFQEPEVKRKK